MYLTVHGAAALVVAKAVPNPLLAFFVSLVSHFVLDLIPHGDEHLTDGFALPRTIKRLMSAAIIDGVILLFFILIYFTTTPSISLYTIIFSLLGSLLPDLLQAIYALTGVAWLKKYSSFHAKLHNLPGYKINWVEGMLVQIFTLTALWLIAI
ncbi:MAG: hypothetical protein WC575_01715 [Patescibacteria group bacterium]